LGGEREGERLVFDASTEDGQDLDLDIPSFLRNE
jgi:hypothetical protein